MSLLDYKKNMYPYSLDGRYFVKVLSNERYPSLVTTPLTISVDPLKMKVNSNSSAKINIVSDNLYPSLLRLILVLDNGSEEISKHSNLLILNNKNNTILRFDPMDHPYQDIINKHIKFLFPGYTFIMDPRHPQHKDSIDNYCVAYVIKYAYYYINKIPIEFDESHRDDIICSDDDIEQFCSLYQIFIWTFRYFS